MKSKAKEILDTQVQPRLEQLMVRVSMIQAELERVAPIVVRVHSCANRHEFVAPVEYGPTVNISGERSVQCPVCGEHSSVATPWMLRYGDRLMPMIFGGDTGAIEKGTDLIRKGVNIMALSNMN